MAPPPLQQPTPRNPPMHTTTRRIALAIAHGRPGTAMVGWKTQLSDGDIARLAEHVHSRFVLGQAQAGSAAISGTTHCAGS